MEREPLFTEFPPVSYEEWESRTASEVKGKVMWGPADAPAGEQLPLQPWPSREWELLETAPEGLFEIDESLGPLGQLQAAMSSDASAFLVPVDTIYFQEIAKFRAMRRLFDREIRIVAITGRSHQTMYDAHVNLVRATSCAMSAIAGGCDALVVRPFDAALHGEEGSSELARRLARNTQHLLREEARFAAQADPAAGSWYIESLTQKFVDGARSGRIDKPATSPRVLVGTTKYASPMERIGVREVSEGRIATPWEQLRQAVERSGRTPKIRIVLGKDPAMSRARAEFARGVFAAAGFSIGEPAEFTVLCAADAEYASLALRWSGAGMVIVAGPPTIGVFDFVNMKSDILAKLKRWQKVAGIVA